METGYLKTLELNKIIERAAAGCVCKEARAKMLELTPQCDPDGRYRITTPDCFHSGELYYQNAFLSRAVTRDDRKYASDVPPRVHFPMPCVW